MGSICEWDGDFNVGIDGYNTMRRYGGITARVISPGMVQIGDECVAIASLNNKSV
jgi:MOSC domain-containing protein YiiM